MSVATVLKRAAVGIVSGTLLAVAPIGPALAATQTSSNQQSCSGNSVISGGADSPAELKQDYTANKCDVQAVYNYFGITSASAFDGMVGGYVDTQNNVYTGSSSQHTLVGKNAMTAGRDNISGSTAILGGKFYKRPPSVSFASSPLAALVKLDGNGKFLFAVITSCGNPVIATAVVPAPKPQPQPKPQPTVKNTVKVVNNNTNVNNNTAVAAVPQQPTHLPDTGASSVAGIFAGASSIGTLGYRFFLKRRLAR